MVGAIAVAEIIIGGCRRSPQTHMPEQPTVSAGVAIGIKSINAVVHGSDEHDVVSSLGWNGQGRDVQWLGIDLPIDGIGEDLAERAGVYIGGGEDGFVRILAGAGEIIVIGEDVDLGGGERRAEEECRPVFWGS